MAKLKRWLTEILLDVTTEMIYEVAVETHKQASKKGTLRLLAPKNTFLLCNSVSYIRLMGYRDVPIPCCL